jgi:tetratricopeptide (TPR) repeat protein
MTLKNLFAKLFAWFTRATSGAAKPAPSATGALVERTEALLNKTAMLAEQGEDADSLVVDALRSEAEEIGHDAVVAVTEALADTPPVLTVPEIEAPASVQQVPTASQPTTPAIPTKGYLLNKISVAASRKKGQAELTKVLSLLKQYYPNALEEAERRIARAKRLTQFKTEMVNRGKNLKERTQIIKQMEEEGFSFYEIKIVEDLPDKIKQIREIRRKSHAVEFARNDVPQVAKSHDVPVLSPLPSLASTFSGLHPNSITDLAPASSWTILFDETGTDFGATVFDEGLTNSISLGRLVALVVPCYTALPAVKPGWHSCEEKLTDVYKIVQNVLNAKCGILGIPVTGLYRIQAEQWFACIETLLDFILRLLPININERTKIEVLVEKRGHITTDNSNLLQKVCDDVLFHLSQGFPLRAGTITINGKIIGKKDSPLNGYVDAVAFTWGSPNTKDILKQTRWLDSCLIQSNPDIVRDSIALLQREKQLRPDDWECLVNREDGVIPNSLVSSLLRCLGEEAFHDSEIWRKYLDHTLRHLDSKAIDLHLLGRQINWLKSYQPAETQLPKKMRLLWLTIQLANENHRGQLGFFENYKEEFVNLCKELYEEDAPLTCFVALHLAVSLTDMFEFEKAKGLLSLWKDKDPAIPGLKYYGQVLSSLGQHAAFLGDNSDAIELFKNSLNVFMRLSDEKAARRDITQTAAYLVIACMDSPQISRRELAPALDFYFGKMSITEAIERFASSTEPADKYAHHTLLRFLASSNATAGEKSAYLQTGKEWGVGEGHPWELIEFYRAVLLWETGDKSEAACHLRNAAGIARIEGGATLDVIAAVALGSLISIDESVKDEYRALVNSVKDALPALGDERIKALEEQPQRKTSPLTLAQTVLPFNFR